MATDPMVSIITPSLAGKAIIAAWAAKSPGAATTNLGYPLAQAIAEGSFTHYFLGTNNWGAYHATKKFEDAHGQDPGYGMVAFLDHWQVGAKVEPVIVRMRCYPSAALGARGFLDLVVAMVGDLGSVSSENDYATRLYVHGYYGGFSTPVTPLSQRQAASDNAQWLPGDLANIAAYASIIKAHEDAAQAGLEGAADETGDPTAVSVGPPFATLGERLTPGPKVQDYSGNAVDGAPHTVDRARVILGPYADNPPAGAISIGDCLAAPTGDGVWLWPAGNASSQPVPTPTPTPAPSGAPAAPSSDGVGTFVALLAGAAAGAAGALALAPKVRRGPMMRRRAAA